STRSARSRGWATNCPWTGPLLTGLSVERLAVQRRACASAWAASSVPTIAEGTAIAKPVRTREVLAAIRRSGGVAVSVSEEAIVEAMNDLAKPGGHYSLSAADDQRWLRGWD